MSKTEKTNSFSDSFEELEEIVAWFDSSDATDLDESLKKFERGAELSKEIKKYLETAENKVEKIKAEFDIQ